MGRRATRVGLIVALMSGVLIPGVAVIPAAAAETIGVPYQPPDSTVTFQGNALHDGNVVGATVTPPLARRWSRDLGGRVSYPVIVNGRVFVTASNGPCCGQGVNLFALDSRTGQDVWGPVYLGHAFQPRSGLAYGAGLIFALNTEGIVAAFDARTGQQRWTVTLTEQYYFEAPITYANGVVYVAGEGVGGTVYAIGATDGARLWTRSTIGNPASAPSVSNRAVYVSQTCETEAFSAATGAIQWSRREPCSWPAGGGTSVLSNGRLWIREAGPSAYPGRPSAALDVTTGQPVGTFVSQYAPAFAGSTGFFLDGGVLTARNALTQTALWSFTGDGSLNTAPLVANGHVYVASGLGLMWALDMKNGEPVWSDYVGDLIAGSQETNVSRPLSGLGAGDGMVVVPATNLLVAYAGVPKAPGEGLPYHPMSPTRILDTRVPLGAPAGKLGPGVALPLQVTGRGGVPASGVSAVVLNVTVTEPTAGSFLTAWPSGYPRPVASNLNFVAGDTVPNLVTVKVGEGGRVALYNDRGATHVVADVAGWYGTDALDGGAAFNALPPARIFDTRSGGGKVGPGATLDVQVAGKGEVPVSGVSAVVLNVTVTEPTAGSFLTVWPAGGSRPLASSLNFGAGQTRPNLVIVKLGAGGKVSLFNNLGSTHIVADVAGWYGVDPTPGAGFVTLAPARVLDTRAGTPAARLGPGATLAIQVTGRGGVPATGVSAVVLNVTVTEPTAVSYLTAWPGGEDRPLASNLNFVAGETVPNLVVVKVGAGGQVALYNNSGTTHAVADVAGWFGI